MLSLASSEQSSDCYVRCLCHGLLQSSVTSFDTDVKRPQDMAFHHGKAASGPGSFLRQRMNHDLPCAKQH